jgi:IS30 family transposase
MSLSMSLIKVANKDTESVVSALIKQSRRLPSELYRSLTWDRGKSLPIIGDWH